MLTALVLLVVKFLAANAAFVSGVIVTILVAIITFVIADPTVIVLAIVSVIWHTAMPFVLIWLTFERGRKPSKVMACYWRLLGGAAVLAWRALVALFNAIYGRSKPPTSGGKR